nr:MAG TPA: hypothetical protein [Caudoviricetes sp.]
MRKYQNKKRVTSARPSTCYSLPKGKIIVLHFAFENN